VDENHIVLNVDGMSCAHCKSNIETNLRKIEGIKFVNADFINGYVSVEGDNLDLTQIKNIINGIGYTVREGTK